jgi:hypothetical protein
METVVVLIKAQETGSAPLAHVKLPVNRLIAWEASFNAAFQAADCPKTWAKLFTQDEGAQPTTLRPPWSAEQYVVHRQAKIDDRLP